MGIRLNKIKIILISTIFLTILGFSIYKSYYVSEQKTKQVSIYSLFVREYITRISQVQKLQNIKLLTKIRKTRKNCFSIYLKLMSPLNAAICTTTYLERQKCYGPDKKILFKKTLFDLEVNGQGLTKVITVRDTPPYGHAPTYQISLTYLDRQKCYGPDKKILFKKQLFDLKVKVQRRSLRYATDHLMVMHPHTIYP